MRRGFFLREKFTGPTGESLFPNKRSVVRESEQTALLTRGMRRGFFLREKFTGPTGESLFPNQVSEFVFSPLPRFTRQHQKEKMFLAFLIWWW
jgi:hypothetical protein